MPASCKGPPFRVALIFDEPDPTRFHLIRTLYMQELLREGVLTQNGIMLSSYAHDEQVTVEALDRMGRALQRIGEALARDELERRIEIPPVFF